jgi:hypothetical protein
MHRSNQPSIHVGHEPDTDADVFDLQQQRRRFEARMPVAAARALEVLTDLVAAPPALTPRQISGACNALRAPSTLQLQACVLLAAARYYSVLQRTGSTAYCLADVQRWHIMHTDSTILRSS